MGLKCKKVTKFIFKKIIKIFNNQTKIANKHINFQEKRNLFNKIIAISLMLIIFFYTLSFKNFSNANLEDNEKVNLDEIQKTIETSANLNKDSSSNEPKLDSRIALVYDRNSGNVLYEKNGHKTTPMASTTKIMTAIVAIERCNMDEIVDVSAAAANQEGSAAYISEGNQYYMKDLLYGLMLNSGNDASVAIAEHVAGSEESFAELMNEKAEELGLGNTHFMNPSGLDNPEHYTTVYNLALIARYAMTLPQFREIVATQTAQAQALNSDEILYFSNHNKMLSLYEGANGIKTGFTKSTGRCLVSSAQRDGMEFIAVTLNDPNDWNDHAEMLDYAFSEHYPKKLIEQGDTVKVTNIDGKDYSMVAASDFTIPFKEHQKTQVEVISHISNDLQAPINRGEKVGCLEIVCDGVSVGEVDIISENDIYGVSNIRLKNSFFSSFIRVAKILLV